MTVSMLNILWLLARLGYRGTYVGTMLLLLTDGIAGGLSSNFKLVLAALCALALGAA